MIERIRLHDLVETHFLCLSEHTTSQTVPSFLSRHYRNKDYKTLLVQTSKHKLTMRTWNFIQCRSYEVHKKLALKYPDEVGGMAVSAIEQLLEEIDFGLGDVREGANSLIIDIGNQYSSPARIAAWMKKNCSDEVVLLEGNRRVRASFSSDDDFLLARINFS